ncbi:hypothetical protein GCM10010840_27440 [Deinococcus aerolatus]|uniref:PIN domain-containing protein n=1 Tax=Deinococcus aerolatus TaxID=522487 RepID=A0ABQ2GDS4_9DEIO|nr:hypothetical protein GCM10010840_27440 [Deinococcus aerolatus]
MRPGEVGLSAVTEAELLHGVYKSARLDHNLAAVLDFASQLVVLPFDSQVTDAYGRVRAGLEKIGQPIGPLDFQIAATTLAHGLILVTNNTREFARVPDLKLEDWTQGGWIQPGKVLSDYPERFSTTGSRTERFLIGRTNVMLL